MALLMYLGFWQLDRQEQKRTFNTMMAERWRMPSHSTSTPKRCLPTWRNGVSARPGARRI
jgi:cytochrome oxidase assembly protein ShyY1